ncbi:ATP-dependent helicase/nuclease subunit B [Mariprofundus micogutta]|uniref:ATP-dependent helicase/nuclease subunit B n=1 Tax=Mariprofundus micogutta TaxID=1921010 RepID=A0A1L8CQJ2_9PROT|nr:PD-(D/E)XK nuclease family protein [Mariprofundus micogutta]GAV21188.1 ATP-dependent helicase/nuclease subunit B [Mariprofundus micogutta]
MQQELFNRQLNIDESISASGVSSSLDKGGLLITASSKQAVDWKRRLVAESVLPVCETPHVLSWQEWLLELSKALPAFPVPLNRMQETELWQQVIRKDLGDSSQSSSSIRGLAKHASQAYTIMQEYAIKTEELSFSGEESDALLRWISGLHNKLDSEPLCGRMLVADLAKALLPAILDLCQKRQLLLDGFHSFTPMQEKILCRLQAAGISIVHIEHEGRATEQSMICCETEQQELQYISSRVQTELQAQPQARIAVAVSDSVDVRLLHKVLNRTLMPERVNMPDHQMLVANMAALPLSEMPMIQQLLHMLTLAGKDSVSFADFSRLLFSPYLMGYAQERFDRAGLDRTLRMNNRHYLSLQFLIESKELEGMPDLSSALMALTNWQVNNRPAREWVKALHQLLQDTGFIHISFAESERSNHEIRQLNTFRDCLSSLVALDAVTNKVSWTRFLALLRTACSDAQLALPIKYPNLSVLPISQMAGLQFDKLFVAGFDAQAFPLSSSPQPLLPLPVQQKYRVSMSRPALAYEYSAFLWQQLLQAAPEVYISWSKQSGDQESLNVSAFAGCLDVSACPETALPATEKAETESFDDAVHMPLSVDETIRGGTALIRDQSGCPFRAYTRYRLHVRELEETEPGIEATTKGSLIHLALEHIWQKLKSQAALKAMSADEQTILIEQAIDDAWQKNRSAVTTSTQSVEKRRMFLVLNDWLNEERQRPAFDVIAIEKLYELDLPRYAKQKLRIHITADRMDRDQQGHRILIDYKTGAKQSFSKWLGERMEEPQLPLYALAAALGEHDAVSFARIRSGEMGFEGLCGESTGIKGMTICDGKRSSPEDWQALLNDWAEQTDSLAEEFIQGLSTVSPRDEKACRYCGLEAVCRIEETGFDQDTGDDDE